MSEPLKWSNNQVVLDNLLALLESLTHYCAYKPVDIINAAMSEHVALSETAAGILLDDGSPNSLRLLALGQTTPDLGWRSRALDASSSDSTAVMPRALPLPRECS